MGSKEVNPGSDLTLNINVACPNSDVVLLAVDKRVSTINSENKFSRDEVRRVMVSMDNR